MNPESLTDLRRHYHRRGCERTSIASHGSPTVAAFAMNLCVSAVEVDDLITVFVNSKPSVNDAAQVQW